MDPTVVASSAKKDAMSTQGFCPYVCFENIVTWKNPIATACVLAAVDFICIFFYAFHWSPLNFFSLGALGAMGIGFAASLMLDTSAHEAKPVQLVSKAQLEEHMVVLYDLINCSATYARSVVLWRDRSSSIRCCLSLALLAYVSARLRFFTVLFLGFNLVVCSKHIHAAYVLFLQPHVEHVTAIAKEHLKNTPFAAQHPKSL